MANSKYYVVWNGRKPGIYTSWEECKKQVHKYSKAEYVSFLNKKAAEDAFKVTFADYQLKITKELKQIRTQCRYIHESVSLGVTHGGMYELGYRCVNTKTDEVLFWVDYYDDASIDEVEFIAIVHCIRYCKGNGITVPIYSNCSTAINGVYSKKAISGNQAYLKNKDVIEAEKWLSENEFSNSVLQWKKELWGENPACFEEE